VRESANWRLLGAELLQGTIVPQRMNSGVLLSLQRIVDMRLPGRNVLFGSRSVREPYPDVLSAWITVKNVGFS
jgi:hypothetical protein